MHPFARPILVDVDTQHDFMRPTGALYVPGAEALEPTLARLVAACHAAGVPHLATLDTHTPDDPEFAAFGFPPHCVAGTPGWAKVAATAAGPGMQVFEKAAFDAFTNPRFAPAVAGLAPSCAIVVGVATDYCVKAAVLGLRQMGVEVRLVADAIAPVAADTGAAALAEMLAAGAELVSADAVLAGLAAGRKVA